MKTALQMAEVRTPRIISVDALPSGSSVTFKSSSFLSTHGPDAVLPTPAEIQEKSHVQNPRYRDMIYHPPVRFEALVLIVKFGHDPEATIAEGQCLWALRRVLPHLPVPEIYGWNQDGDNVFLYMELINGVTLEEQWGLPVPRIASANL